MVCKGQRTCLCPWRDVHTPSLTAPSLSPATATATAAAAAAGATAVIPGAGMVLVAGLCVVGGSSSKRLEELAQGGYGARRRKRGGRTQRAKREGRKEIWCGTWQVVACASRSAVSVLHVPPTRMVWTRGR
ncbi:unnamed protein product [Closterium sp. NIES-54]